MADDMKAAADNLLSKLTVTKSIDQQQLDVLLRLEALMVSKFNALLDELRKQGATVTQVQDEYTVDLSSVAKGAQGKPKGRGR